MENDFRFKYPINQIPGYRILPQNGWFRTYAVGRRVRGIWVGELFPPLIFQSDDSQSSHV